MTRTFLYASVERFADWVKYEDAKAGAVTAVVTLAATDLMGQAQEAAKAGLSKAWVFCWLWYPSL